jgi:vancomycin resistance protein VanJ
MAAQKNAAPSTAAIGSTTNKKPPAGPRILRRIVGGLVVAYAIGIVLLWLWMYLRGDRTWLATLFLFGPRWVCALPLLPLAVVAAIWHRRMLGVLALTAVLIVGPILGFVLNFAGGDGMVALRVLTCNANQSQLRADRLSELIERESPDIVALQEVTGRLPRIAWPRGWFVLHKDEFVVGSRYPVYEREGMPSPDVPGKLVVIRYTIQLPHDEVQLFNLHLFSPREGLQAVLEGDNILDGSNSPDVQAMLRARENESLLASQWIARFSGPKIVVGDFNTPIESNIFRKYWSSYDNAFSTAGLGFGFTKITELRGWKYGTRIDHVLSTPPWRFVRAWVGPDVGSDHLPLVAELD